MPVELIAGTLVGQPPAKAPKISIVLSKQEQRQDDRLFKDGKATLIASGRCMSVDSVASSCFGYASSDCPHVGNIRRQLTVLVRLIKLDSDVAFLCQTFPYCSQNNLIHNVLVMRS